MSTLTSMNYSAMSSQKSFANSMYEMSLCRSGSLVFLIQDRKNNLIVNQSSIFGNLSTVRTIDLSVNLNFSCVK